MKNHRYAQMNIGLNTSISVGAISAGAIYVSLI
jgi:hypothetical protein